MVDCLMVYIHSVGVAYGVFYRHGSVYVHTEVEGIGRHYAFFGVWTFYKLVVGVVGVGFLAAIAWTYYCGVYKAVVALFRNKYFGVV